MMSKEEICASYRDAKKKTEQIRILAELNAVNEQEIKEILKEGGYLTPGPKKKAEQKKEQKEEPKQILREKEAAKFLREMRKPATINEDFENAVNEMIEQAKEIATPADSEKVKEAAGQKMVSAVPDAVIRVIQHRIEELAEMIRRRELEVEELSDYLATVQGDKK